MLHKYLLYNINKWNSDDLIFNSEIVKDRVKLFYFQYIIQMIFQRFH